MGNNPLIMHLAERQQFRREVFVPVIRQMKGHILEVGCGRTPQLEQYQCADKVTFVDRYIETSKLRQLKATNRIEVEVWRRDIAHLPFKDDVFDGMVASFVFCSVASIDACVTELTRVCRKNATCVVLEHVASANSLFRASQTLVSPLYAAFRKGCRLDRNPARHFQGSGWKILTQYSTGHLTPWLCFVGLNQKEIV